MTVSVKVNFHIGNGVIATVDDARAMLGGVPELSGLSQHRLEFINSGQIVSQELTLIDNNQFCVETVFADQAACDAFVAASDEARATAFDAYNARGWVVYAVE